MASPRLLTGRRSEGGHWYVITTVTLNRRPLFTDTSAARALVEEIQSIPEDHAETHAWVVMPDHLHWLLQLNVAADLSRLAQRLKSKSAIRINRARGATGSVWQSGFYDHGLRADEDLEAQARYLVTNPIRRGLVQRIDDYPHWWCRWIGSGSDLAG